MAVDPGVTPYNYRERTPQRTPTTITTGADLAEAYLNAYLAAGANLSPGSSGDGGAAARDVARRQLEIQERKVQFQLETGLRDIEDAREQGLRGAINNALQRGIYRSGIRIENEAEVNEDADNAVSDLRKEIEFALEALKLSREGISASAAAAGTAPEAHPYGITPDQAITNAVAIGNVSFDQLPTTPAPGSTAPRATVPPNRRIKTGGGAGGTVKPA